MLLTDANEFTRLLRHVEDAARSSFLSERILAFRTLIRISYKLKGKLEIMFEGNANTFLSRVVLSVCDKITQLITQVSVGSGNSEIEQEFRSMLKFLLVLVESHSELDYFILDKLYSMIENTVNSHNMPLQNSAVHKAVKARVEETSFSLRIFMFHIHRFLVVFLENLDEVGASNNQVVLKIKDLVSFVCGSSLFDCSIHSFYGLLLHSPVIWGSLLYEDKKISDFVQNTGETSIHECVGNILAGRDNWCAYRAGKFAACEGVWYVANMIFQRLETRVQSQFCCQWLKLLVNFTHIEKNAQMLLQKVCQPRPQHNDDMEVILSGDLEKFHEICDDIFSSDKVLEAISVQTQTLYFQRWFLGFRVKFLLVLTDILKILENIRLSGGIDLSDVSYFLRKLKGLNGISSKLTRLVEECNLMASSFVNIDSKSLKVISFMAFSCSLFGFFIEFTNLTVDSLVSKNPSESFGDSWHGFVGDLAKRLWHADSKTHMKLMSLLKEYGVDEGSLHLLPFFQFLKISRIPEDILKVCRHSFKEMIQLRNESLNVHNEDTVPQVSKAGIQVLSNIVAAVTHIPFWVPEYFFRVRPSVGSVLISSSASSRKQNTLLVSPGSHLALNLCLQLKNVPSDLCSFSKIYCILNCKTSSGANKGLMPCREVQRGYQASETDMMIDLSKKLQCYVMKQTREFSNHDNLQSSDEMEAYVCFETMHGAQCFSNCVLDVSAFPVGSYTVDWHCGFVDRHGAFWSLLPLSHGPVFSVGESSFHN